MEMVLAVDYAFYVSFLLMKEEHQVFIGRTMYLWKSFSFQINNQFHWTRKLALSTVVFLVSFQPRFHAALFKYTFRSTKVDFAVFTLTLYF